MLGSVLFFWGVFFWGGGVKFPYSARWHPTSEHQADLLIKGGRGYK